MFYRALSHHGEHRHDGRNAPDYQQQEMTGRKAIENREQSQPEEPTKIDYPGMEQCRDRRGRLHNPYQPPVKRYLSTLERGGNCE